MSGIRLFMSLTTRNNDYQRAQADAARRAAEQLDVQVDVDCADMRAALQGSQLMLAITSHQYRGVLFEPVSFPLPNVAHMAVVAGCALAVLNREPDYLKLLEPLASAPLFSISSDHVEVGRTQGKQLVALFPAGGSVLVVQGPFASEAARLRREGLVAAAPRFLLHEVIGDWTEAGAEDAVAAWLPLHEGGVDAVVAQNDAMAIGAGKALSAAATRHGTPTPPDLPILGADGLPGTGLRWFREGRLTATTRISPNAGRAIELMVGALRGGPRPPLSQRVQPESVPPLNELRPALSAYAGTSHRAETP